MCQDCVPGLAVDGYDCDSDLDFDSDNECACPHDHKAHKHEHEHEYQPEQQHKHEHEQAPIINQEETGHFQEVAFPSDPFFTRLINTAHQNKDGIIINDSARGLKLTYSQFLHDVQMLRLKIQNAIPSSLLDATGSFKDGAGYVAVLAEIQYPFFVASLAILSMGGVIVPMGHAPEAEQVLAIVEESKAVALVFDPTQVDVSSAISKENESLIQLPIDISQAQQNSEEHGQFRFVTASAGDLAFSANRPALLLYGGDGEPNTLTRQSFYDQATGGSNSATAEMSDAMMLCMLICLSSGPAP
ncbi:hypothetical protein P168DRAFT_330810 [Aspergillus campestris IBT 28561]|uniref:AMP-dependent synthetase/ligase domain-containing protein n=1 Tax=Aspergillus campestris (strain IBT 28561) TaxID=1392248 RepID=A0A2I1CQV1_ASPC2|nr:uncharacterized protein P168DRAFT_330810 [Aspergillus campestris IBT 28561]PKX99998.1 hypothetical protein P168DRAFT_330810 [Aspergillus campestris IBT 28561]